MLVSWFQTGIIITSIVMMQTSEVGAKLFAIVMNEFQTHGYMNRLNNESPS